MGALACHYRSGLALLAIAASVQLGLRARAGARRLRHCRDCLLLASSVFHGARSCVAVAAAGYRYMLLPLACRAARRCLCAAVIACCYHSPAAQFAGVPMLCHCYGCVTLVAGTTRPQQSSWARLPAVAAVGSHFWLSPLVCSSACRRATLPQLSSGVSHGARSCAAVAAPRCRCVPLPLACCADRERSQRRLAVPSLWVGDVASRCRPPAAQVGSLTP